MRINPLSHYIFHIGSAEDASLFEDEERDINEGVPVKVAKDSELHL